MWQHRTQHVTQSQNYRTSYEALTCKFSKSLLPKPSPIAALFVHLLLDTVCVLMTCRWPPGIWLWNTSSCLRACCCRAPSASVRARKSTTWNVNDDVSTEDVVVTHRVMPSSVHRSVGGSPRGWKVQGFVSKSSESGGLFFSAKARNQHEGIKKITRTVSIKQNVDKFRKERLKIIYFP